MLLYNKKGLITVKAFFIDIDGTLANDKKVIPEENIKAIGEAQKKGCLVFINTGRASSRLPYELCDIASPDGVITSLGATVKLHGETIYTNYTSVEETIEAFKIASPSGWHMYFDTEYKKYEINPPKDRIDLALSERGTQRERLLALSTKNSDDIITSEEYIKKHSIMLSKIVAFPEKTGYEQIEKLSGLFIINKAADYYDLSLKSTGKDIAVKFICGRLGINISDTVAIGDSENDISMLRCAGVGAVVKNGSPNAKKYADFISEKTNNESAVAEIIRKFM